MPGALATRYVVMDGASKLTFRMLRTSVPDWDTLLQRFREGTAPCYSIRTAQAGLRPNAGQR